MAILDFYAFKYILEILHNLQAEWVILQWKKYYTKMRLISMAALIKTPEEKNTNKNQ